jgi:hypothetical protein
LRRRRRGEPAEGEYAQRKGPKPELAHAGPQVLVAQSPESRQL